MSVLVRFLAFYAAVFAAFGVASPFLPGLLQEHGLDASRLGVTLASGPLYRHLGAPAFWAMAALCVAAVPVALGVRAAEVRTAGMEAGSISAT